MSGLEKEIEQLKEYQTQWEQTVNAYKTAQEEMTAAAILGSDWREKLLNKDMDIMQSYEQGYNDLKNTLNNVISPMLEQANADLDVYEKQIDLLKDQKDAYNEMKDSQKKYLDFFKTYADDLDNATDSQVKAWNKLSDAIERYTKVSNFGKIDSSYDLAMAMFDEDYEPQYESTINALKSLGIEELNEGQKELITQLTALVTAGKTIFGSDNNIITYSVGEMAKGLKAGLDENNRNLIDAITNNDNQSYNDNRTIEVNNPVFDSSGTYDQFITFLNKAFTQLDQDTKVGKKK